MIGQSINSYRIVRALGEGGMGAVYEAVHETIGRRAAIKILHADHARNGEVIARFHNEARAVNIVQHSGLVSVYDVGQTPQGAAFIIMEYLEGESLRTRLTRVGRLGNAALRLGRQMAAALAAAHQHGIIHRDLKPENVMIIPEPEAQGGERTKILDFGIAKLLPESGQAGTQRTRTGLLMGTPMYMSPEQCRGAAQAGDRTDVYALGIVLYEMLLGRPPFLGDMGELIAMHIYAPVPAMRSLDPLLAEEVATLVERMLAKEASARPSMADVLQQLTRLWDARSTLSTDATSKGAAAPTIVLPPELLQRSTLGSSSGQVQSSPAPGGAPGTRRGLLLGALGLIVVLGAAGVTAQRSRGPAQAQRALSGAATVTPPTLVPAASPPAPISPPPAVTHPPVEPSAAAVPTSADQAPAMQPAPETKALPQRRHRAAVRSAPPMREQRPTGKPEINDKSKLWD